MNNLQIIEIIKWIAQMQMLVWCDSRVFPLNWWANEELSLEMSERNDAVKFSSWNFISNPISRAIPSLPRKQNTICSSDCRAKIIHLNSVPSFFPRNDKISISPRMKRNENNIPVKKFFLNGIFPLENIFFSTKILFSELLVVKKIKRD